MTLLLLKVFVQWMLPEMLFITPTRTLHSIRSETTVRWKMHPWVTTWCVPDLCVPNGHAR